MRARHAQSLARVGREPPASDLCAVGGLQVQPRSTSTPATYGLNLVLNQLNQF